MKKRNHYLILLFILWLSFFLRVYNLDHESFWVDEGVSIKVAQFDLPQLVQDRAVNAHPPVYFFLLHYWVALFGTSEFSARFLSAIFGLLAVAVIYKIGQLLFEKYVGVLSALLLGISVFHIHYSQEARSYTLLTLLTLLSMYFFIRLLKKRSLGVSIAYLLPTTLLMYTHASGVFVIVAQNISFLTLSLLSKKIRRPDFVHWVLLQAVLVILFLPWVQVFFSQVQKVQSGYWIPPPSLRSITASLKEYSSGSRFLMRLFLILALLAAFTYQKSRGSLTSSDFFNRNILQSFENYRWNIRLSNLPQFYLLLVWLLTLIGLPFVISAFTTPIYITRITIAASLAFYLLIANGIRNLNNKYAQLALIAVIVGLTSFEIGEYNTRVNKEQWRDVAHYIDANATDEDLLLFNAGFMQTNVFDYYSERSDLVKKPFPAATKDMFFFETTSQADIEELWPLVEGYDRIWVILSHSRDRNQLITENLSETYRLLHYSKYHGIRVYLFGGQDVNADQANDR